MRLTLSFLQTLVEFFDNEHGHSQKCYDAVCELLRITMGPHAVTFFSNHINATEGQFYLKTGILPSVVWTAMMMRSEVKTDYELILRLTDQYDMQQDKDEQGQIILFTNLTKDERQQLIAFTPEEDDEE